MGSSPRVRGTYLSVGLTPRLSGLIPAGAGNISPRRSTALQARAHPRGCGEHFTDSAHSAFAEGSSPRVRGTFSKHYRCYTDAGLIPAGAGNILSGSHNRQNTRAHPRGCGEHDGIYPQRKSIWGSSPRVRGTSSVIRTGKTSSGLIPAGAGNIMTRVTPCWVPGAHPRGCGEHLSLDGLISGATGSSPRVRGTCQLHILY